MPQGRPAIPEAAKRQVRQRCGFGCVICGLPMYTYEHMDDWAVTRSHEPAALTLLCWQHQQEKTNGLLPVDAVRKANDNPVNVARGITRPYGLHYAGDMCEVDIGGNRFLSQGQRLVPLLYNDDELVTFDFSSGELLLSCLVRDQNGNPTLVVDRNEMTVATEAWDIEFVGRTLTMRNAPRRFRFQVTFNPPGGFSISRLAVTYRRYGGEVRLTVDALGIHLMGPGIRERHLSDVTYLGGFEYALVVDSNYQGAAGGYL